MAYPELLERKRRFKAYDDMSLYTLTRDLHHICEDHPVGAAMSRGDVSEQWWADWLHALYKIHCIIDFDLPPELRCCSRIRDDLHACSLDPRPNTSVNTLCARLREDENMRVAAHYVLTGAHLMGGQVMRKTIGDNLPTTHLKIDNRKEVLDLWKPYRERVDVAEEAREVFRSLLAIMNEMLDYDALEQEPRHEL